VVAATSLENLRLGSPDRDNELGYNNIRMTDRMARRSCGNGTEGAKNTTPRSVTRRRALNSNGRRCSREIDATGRMAGTRSLKDTDPGKGGHPGRMTRPQPAYIPVPGEVCPACGMARTRALDRQGGIANRRHTCRVTTRGAA
jgi:hypothetical protein